jgi:hypothetical protein
MKRARSRSRADAPQRPNKKRTNFSLTSEYSSSDDDDDSDDDENIDFVEPEDHIEIISGMMIDRRVPGVMKVKPVHASEHEVGNRIPLDKLVVEHIEVHDRCNRIASSWLEEIASYRKDLRRECVAAIQRKLIYNRTDISTDLRRDINICNGDERVRKMREQLDNFEGYVRSPDQMKFHEAFIQASLPKIYRADWQDHAQRVMEEHKLLKKQPEVMIMTPRRFGKTEAVSMFVASTLLNVPGIKIAIFSTGKRASGGLTDLTYQKILKIKGGYERVVKKNEEHLFIAGEAIDKNEKNEKKSKEYNWENEVDTARLYSFPAAVASKSHIDTIQTTPRFNKVSAADNLLISHAQRFCG